MVAREFQDHCQLLQIASDKVIFFVIFDQSARKLCFFEVPDSIVLLYSEFFFFLFSSLFVFYSFDVMVVFFSLGLGSELIFCIDCLYGLVCFVCIFFPLLHNSLPHDCFNENLSFPRLIFPYFSSS